MSSVAPDRNAMANHVKWMVEAVLLTHSELRLELAWGEPGQGPNRARTYGLDEIEDLTGFAAWINAKGCNVYIGVTLKKADTPFKGRTSTAHAALAVCLAIDIDGNFLSGLQRLESIAKPQLLVTTGTTPEPRGQIWIRTTATDDMTLWEEVNRRSVDFCGGDRNALGNYRLMRLAGSVSYPSPRKQKRGYITEVTSIKYCGGPDYTLRALLNKFPPLEEKGVEPRKSLRRSQHQCRIPVNAINVAIVLSMLNALPDEYAFDYDLWLRVGFALHSFDPGELGRALWTKFSERVVDKAEITNFQQIWAGFERPYDGEKITLGWLQYHAQQHGWRIRYRWDVSEVVGAE